MMNPEASSTTAVPARPKDHVSLQWVVDNFQGISGAYASQYLPSPTASTESPSWSLEGFTWKLALHSRLLSPQQAAPSYQTPAQPDVAISLHTMGNTNVRVTGAAYLPSMSQRKVTKPVAFDCAVVSTPIKLAPTSQAQTQNLFNRLLVVRLQYSCQQCTPQVVYGQCVQFPSPPAPLCDLQDVGRVGLTSMFDSPCFSDVEVRSACGASYQCHKVVLASASEPLSALFSNGMKETSSSQVVLQDYSAATIDAFIRFLYGLSVRVLQVQDLRNLYRIADQYMVAELKAQCAPQLLANLNSSLHPDLELATDMLANFSDPALKEVRDAVRLYLLIRLGRVMNDPNFLQLPVEAVQHLLSAHPIRAHTERLMLDALLCWVAAEEGRGDMLERLASGIRFDIMSNEELREVRQLVQLKGSPGVQDLIAAVYEQRLCT